MLESWVCCLMGLQGSWEEPRGRQQDFIQLWPGNTLTRQVPGGGLCGPGPSLPAGPPAAFAQCSRYCWGGNPDAYCTLPTCSCSVRTMLTPNDICCLYQAPTTCQHCAKGTGSFIYFTAFIKQPIVCWRVHFHDLCWSLLLPKRLGIIMPILQRRKPGLKNISNLFPGIK